MISLAFCTCDSFQFVLVEYNGSMSNVCPGSELEKQLGKKFDSDIWREGFFSLR